VPKLKTRKFKYPTDQAFIKSILDDVISLEDQLEAHKKLHQSTVDILLYTIDKLLEESKVLSAKLAEYKTAWEQEFG
jgi:hypothetical protein